MMCNIFVIGYNVTFSLRNQRNLYFWRSKVGVLFEGGVIEGGVNKFRPEGAKFLTFFIQKYAVLWWIYFGLGGGQN